MQLSRHRFKGRVVLPLSMFWEGLTECDYQYVWYETPSNARTTLVNACRLVWQLHFDACCNAQSCLLPFRRFGETLLMFVFRGSNLV